MKKKTNKKAKVKKMGRPKGTKNKNTDDQNLGYFKFPTTEEDFNFLVKTVMDLYNYTDKTLVATILANRIAHSDVTCDAMKWGDLTGAINRFMAYNIARMMNDKMTHEIKVGQLEAQLAANPNDQQALDEIKNLTDQGSKAAKSVYEKFSGLEVTPMEFTSEGLEYPSPDTATPNMMGF